MNKLIVFVCHGNIHRSVVAERALRQLLRETGINKIKVISRGLLGTAGTKPPKHKCLAGYPDEWSITGPILQELGIDVSGHKAKPIDKKTLENATAVFAMDRKVLFDLPYSLTRQFPEHKIKYHLFSEIIGEEEDIPDCDGSADVELHRRANKRIVEIIRRGGTGAGAILTNQ